MQFNDFELAAMVELRVDMVRAMSPTVPHHMRALQNAVVCGQPALALGHGAPQDSD
jgi:hypothetical protein